MRKRLRKSARAGGLPPAAARTAATADLGFINTALYQIGQAKNFYAATFFDIVSGNNSLDPVTGFSAGPGWDPTTGLGSPMADQLINYLIHFTSSGDGTAAIAGSMPHTNGKPSTPGHVTPH